MLSRRWFCRSLMALPFLGGFLPERLMGESPVSVTSATRRVPYCPKDSYELSEEELRVLEKRLVWPGCCYRADGYFELCVELSYNAGKVRGSAYSGCDRSQDLACVCYFDSPPFCDEHGWQAWVRYATVPLSWLPRPEKVPEGCVIRVLKYHAYTIPGFVRVPGHVIAGDHVPVSEH